LFSNLTNVFHHLSRPERRSVYTAVLIAFLATAGLVFISFKNITLAVPVAGGTWTEGIVGQPVFINPVISGNNDADRDLITLTFCSLSDIAEKIEPSNNYQTWQVRLKDNTLWHDGEHLTSDDVIFTIERIQDPEYKSPQSATWQGVTASRVSERELSLSLVAPLSFFPDNLEKLFIIPKHIFADIPLANWRLSDYNLEPVGCGPFQFNSFKKRADGFITQYNLKANPQYVGGAPFISNFVLTFYTDPGQAIEDFIFAKIDGLGGLSKKQLDQIKRNHRLSALPTSRYYSVFINQNASPALKDKNVRLALDTALDRNLLIRETLGGYAEPIAGPVTPNFLEEVDLPAAPASLDPIASAESILEKSGWQLGEDGLRAKKINKNNVALEFDLIVPEVEPLLNIAEAITKTWGEIGVKINSVILPPETINNNVIRGRNFSLLLFGNIIGRSPDLFSFWHSSQADYPGLNLSQYKNKAADKLIESIRRGEDPDEELSDLVSLNTLLSRDLPAIFLYSPQYLYLISPDLKGFSDDLIVTPADRFRGVSSWYLKTARQLK